MQASSLNDSILDSKNIPTIATQDWLEGNPKAFAAVKEGLRQAAEGQTRYRGSFAQYAELEIEEE